MKRLSVLCLVAAGVLYSAAAFASVCFLADTKCQEGKYQISGGDACRDKNPAWIHESKKCSGLVYGGVVCNDATGNYYEEGSCPAGYTDFSTLDRDKYECTSGLLCDRCCLEVTCSSSYQKCENNSVPKSYNAEDVCQDKDIKYHDCECRSPYVLKCEGTGITTAGDYCIDSDGDQYWTACQCASGYRETTVADVKCPSECTNGCSDIGKYYTLPGSANKVCWEGATCRPDKKEVCPIVYQSNFDKFWQGYDVAGDCQNLTVDCDKLGYNTGTAATGDKCKDGTEPYRCPFDHEAVYCESGIEHIAPITPACEFKTKAQCEATYFGSTCVKDGSECWNPNACKSGYGETVGGCGEQGSNGWTLGTKDANGCGECVAKTCPSDSAINKICSSEYTKTSVGYAGDKACYKCEKTCSSGYATKATCETKYFNSTCSNSSPLFSDDCFHPLFCKNQYAKKAEACLGDGEWLLLGEADENGCALCTQKKTTICGYATLDQCLKGTGVSTCLKCSDGNYTIGSCKSGYEQSLGNCIYKGNVSGTGSAKIDYDGLDGNVTNKSTINNK